MDKVKDYQSRGCKFHPLLLCLSDETLTQGPISVWLMCWWNTKSKFAPSLLKSAEINLALYMYMYIPCVYMNSLHMPYDRFSNDMVWVKWNTHMDLVKSNNRGIKSTGILLTYPSGPKSTPRTSLRWPSRNIIHLPVRRSHTLPNASSPLENNKKY